MERLISASFCFVLCSHELPKSEPTCLLNRLEGDTLCLEDKDNGIPERVGSPSWSLCTVPVHSLQGESKRPVILSKNREMFQQWKMRALLGREPVRNFFVV